MVRDGCESILVLFREYSATVCAAGLKYGKAWRAHCTIIAVEVKFIGFSDVRRAGEMGVRRANIEERRSKLEVRRSNVEDRRAKFGDRVAKIEELKSQVEEGRANI